MNGLLRVIFLVYFITHIPITLLVDFQILFGAHYPENLRQVFSWYQDTYKDQLLIHQPDWLRSFIWAELIFQFPFFFVATYGLLFKKNWIRIPSILYGSHVATTVWAIIADLLGNNVNTTQEKYVLFGFYAPYFIIPALLAVYMAMNPKPFGSSEEKKRK